MDFSKFFQALFYSAPGAPAWQKFVIPVLLLVALVYGIFVLVRKVQGAADFVGRIFGSFKGIRTADNSALSEKQVKQIAISSLYAYQQGGYVNVLPLKISKFRLKKILTEWWGITDRNSALEALEGLIDEGHSALFPYVAEAAFIDKKKDRIMFLQEHMPSQEECMRALEQSENLIDNLDSIRSNKIASNAEEIKQLGVMGWDSGRLAFVARACCEQNLISEEEAWHYMAKAYDMAHASFSNYEDFAKSYALGRAVWGSDVYIMSLAKDLLEKPNSPWVQYPW